MRSQKPQSNPYLPIVWAFDITADRVGQDRIMVSGRVPIMDSDVQPDRDAYRRYLSSFKSTFAQKSTRQDSPHIEFANARTDEQLLDFVRGFGPVASAEILEGEPEDSTGVSLQELAELRKVLGAIEELSSLRRERQIYAAALGLLEEVRSGESKSDLRKIRTNVSTIADGITFWPEQWDKEDKWRALNGVAPIGWQFDRERCEQIRAMKFAALWKQSEPPVRDTYADEGAYLRDVTKHALERALRTSPYRAAQNVLCDLVNSFRTEVTCVGDYSIESLPYDAIRFGIRPCLYLILKREFLWGSGTLLCRNDRCNSFFVSERAGQMFCKEECSRKYRQRKYWMKTGATMRKRRRKRSRRKTPA